MAVAYNPRLFESESRMCALYYDENCNDRQKAVSLSQDISPDGKPRSVRVGDCAIFGNLLSAKFILRLKKIK